MLTEEQKKEFEERYWGAMFECGDYEDLLKDIDKFISEAVKEERERIISEIEKYQKLGDISPWGLTEKLEELKTNKE